MKKPHPQHLRYLKSDDASSQVPVSRYVLNLGKILRQTPKKSALKRWRPSFVQQSASFALTLVLCASSFGITYGNPLGTLSYFRDDEVSHDNMFAAGLLAFRLNPGDVTIQISEGELVTLSPLFEPHPDAFAIKYRVRAEIIGTETPLCGLLRASGNSSPYIYDGSLVDLVTQPATTTGHGHLDVTLPNAAGIASTECTVALIYDGWYVDAPENTGYTDRKQDTFTFVYEAPVEEAAPAAVESTQSETTDTATTSDQVADEPKTPPAPPAAKSPVVKQKIVIEDATSTPPAVTKSTSTDDPPPTIPTTQKASSTPPTGARAAPETDTGSETKTPSSENSTTTSTL